MESETQRNVGRGGPWLLAGLVVLGLVGFVALRYGTSSPDLVEQAKSAYAREDWARAAELARTRLKVDDSDEDALRMLARSSIRLGRDPVGAAIYRDRLGKSSLEPEDAFLLGLAALRRSDEGLAYKTWSPVADRPDASPELLLALSNLLARNHKLDEAAALARRLSAVPGWEAAGDLLLGTTMVSLEDHAAAAEALSRGLERDPEAIRAPLDPPVYRKMLARSLLFLGRPADADRWLEPVLSAAAASSPDVEASWLASRAALQQGRMDRAGAELTRSGSYRADHPLEPDPGPFAGSARCTTCHGEINKEHQTTRHWRTFHHGAGLLALPRPEGPLADPDHPKVTHTLIEEGKTLRMQTKAEDRIHDVVVEYAFGVPGRYITMTGRDAEKQARALRLSCYWEGGQPHWGRTAGDAGDADPERTVQGQTISVRDGVVRCLYCHVTNDRAFRDPDRLGTGPEVADAGIGCERCHGPSANHIKAVEADFPDLSVVNAGHASADLVTRQCRDCHIVGNAEEIARAPEKPDWVRSPGITMTFSRCFTESNGEMSCLTCHDAHRDSERSPAFYERKCLGCHSAATPSEEPKHEFSTPDCKVNPTKDCLTCHMPRVPMPVLHTSLTDHFIRVHRDAPR